MYSQQLHAIIAASVSIKSSQKLKKILEVNSVMRVCVSVCVSDELFWGPVLFGCAFMSLCLLCDSSLDHPGPGELHEQQQERSCLWLQTTESGSGEDAAVSHVISSSQADTSSLGLHSYTVIPTLVYSSPLSIVLAN